MSESVKPEIPDPADLKRLATARGAIRAFFAARDFLEVTTPCLVTCPGTEPQIRYFETIYRDQPGNARRLYLRSSPELFLKRMVATGNPKLFELGPAFRNHGEWGPLHRPEFTLLEWYATDLNLAGMRRQTSELVCCVGDALNVPMATLASRPWPVWTCGAIIRDVLGVELVDEDLEFAGRCRAAGVASVRADDDFETAFFKVMIDIIEPRLADVPAVFLAGYPPSQAALSQVIGGEAQRFELYLGGVELCNAFAEQQGQAANRERFLAADLERQRLGYPRPPLDEGFLTAMDGLPPCSGNALGVERLLMALLGVDDLGRFAVFGS